jgi:aminoglycoside 3-N-acetyltransferase
MSELATIERAGNQPATIHTLRNDLQSLGLKPGMVLLVHSSLSSLGWVSGGPVAVILALQLALGDEGTLVMPTHSTDLSDPAHWENPPVPEAWWSVIRDTMPAFDPDLTPTRGMGAIPETFRKQRRTIRSFHPQDSFAAHGPKAALICDYHSLDYGLGESSPLARLYDLEAWVLLLGVGHDRNTSLHLAEYRASFPTKKQVTNGAPVMVDNRRLWVSFWDFDLSTHDFETLGEAFERENRQVRRGHIAKAPAVLFPQRELVDFAVHWMQTNRM